MGRRRLGIEALDLHRDVEQGIGRRRAEVLEIMSRADARHVVRERDPIARSGRTAEDDLEAAVGRDVVLGVVDDPGDPARITPAWPPASMVTEE